MHWNELEVWKNAHKLVLQVYKKTNDFPKNEMFGVISQLRRASSSVPANIVEGQSRNTTKEYLSFLFNARGSLEETRYFLLLSRDLEYLSIDDFARMECSCEKISKMLNALIKKLKLLIP